MKGKNGMTVTVGLMGKQSDLEDSGGEGKNEAGEKEELALAQMVGVHYQSMRAKYERTKSVE